MIDVVRIDHISMAVPELEPQIEFLERLFGFRYRGRFVESGYVGAELEVPGRSGIGWEVLAPDGPDSYLHRFLDGENGPGLHHLALQIRDMNGALLTMEQLGVDPWGFEQRPGGHGAHPGDEDVDYVETPGDQDQDESVVYIHPRRGGAGFLFQLYEGAPWSLPDRFEDERSDTLGITAVNALGHAHHSRQELGDWYERLFGFTTCHQPVASGALEDEPSFSTRVLETPGGQLRIEVMQPLREDSFLQHFLDRRGPAIHHVSFEVRDVDHAVDAARRNGVRVFGQRSGQSEGARWSEAFLAPEHTGGMLVQVFSWRQLTPQRNRFAPTPETPETPAPDEPPDDAETFEDLEATEDIETGDDNQSSTG
jgi:4-hydroxyphenylpyruvate dioxygenase-like putative hemolysin